MKVPGFSSVTSRNQEDWHVIDMSSASSDAEKMSRPCVMPMRDYRDHHTLSGVVYLDYDVKHYPDGMSRKAVIKALRSHPSVKWAGRSAGNGALALAYSTEVAGRPIETGEWDYLMEWDALSSRIEQDTGLVADEGARGVNRVVFLPKDRVDWEPPRPHRVVSSDGPRKGRLGRGSPPPSAVDRAVAAEPDLENPGTFMVSLPEIVSEHHSGENHSDSRM